MARRVRYFEYSLFGQQRLHFISSYNISLLQGLDCKVLSRVSVLRQYHLAEVSTTENRQQPEVLQSHTIDLRVSSRLVGTIPILKGSDWQFVHSLKDKDFV